MMSMSVQKALWVGEDSVWLAKLGYREALSAGSRRGIHLGGKTLRLICNYWFHYFSS